MKEPTRVARRDAQMAALKVYQRAEYSAACLAESWAAQKGMQKVERLALPMVEL